MADKENLTKNSVNQEKVKDNKNTNDTSKEVKVEDKEMDVKLINLLVQEVVDDKIIINFHGRRIALPNEKKKVGNIVEIRYNGDNDNFKIIEVK